MDNTLNESAILKAENIALQTLTDEIVTILTDELIADFERDGNVLKMTFLNGQKFTVTVQNA